MRKDNCRTLHEMDKAAGTKCGAPRTRKGKCNHRMQGWKNAKAGICRAKAVIMRRISKAVVRETARHITRGLDVVGPR